MGFVFVKSENLNSIEFYSSGELWSYLEKNKIIIPYGPINNFISNKYYWRIHKLTKKEMHLSVDDNSKKYELFFKKTSQ